jgi:hypothetical protein
MKPRSILLCLLLAVAPAALAAAEAQPVTLDELAREVRTLRRLVQELIVARQEERVARCENDREAAALRLASGNGRRSALDRRRSELAAEREDPATEAARALDLSDEIERLERDELVPLERDASDLERSLRLIGERCAAERRLYEALTDDASARSASARVRAPEGSRGTSSTSR